MEAHARPRAEGGANAHQCEYCGKTLSCKQSKYKHKKRNCRATAVAAAVAAVSNGGVGWDGIERLQRDMTDVKRVLMQLASGMQPAGADGARADSVDHLDYETAALLIKGGDLPDGLQEMVRIVHYDPASRT